MTETLSDKRQFKPLCVAYPVKDVKKFIEDLKECKGIEHDGSFISIGVLRKFIDKLAGGKLL